MKKRSIYIMVSVLLLALAVCYTDAVIQPNYVIKSIIKIIFYLLIPMIYFLFNKDEFDDFKKLFSFKAGDLKKTFLLAIIVYVCIVGGYFLVRNFIDFSHVTGNLLNNMGINADNFLYVTIYIAFLNSFLEEFFYRGYAFITLKKHIDRKIAYFFSALVFAFYHIGMILESFVFPDILLIIFGLVFGGCVFNYLNEKSNNIYPSWIVHMFTNFGINTVGFILFSIM